MAAAGGTIRISEASKKALRELADRERVPMQTVLDRAIENYRRNRFLDAVNQTYADLRNDEAWHAEAQERDDWDVNDGSSD
jgi:predicted transcriptional regulator